MTIWEKRKGTHPIGCIPFFISYGDKITFEQTHKNVGFWSGENDFVRWQIDLTKDGRYDVWLDWSCGANSSGTSFVCK